MAQKPETLFKNRIRPILETIPNSHWFKIQQVVIAGTPDFLGVISGWMVGLELKASLKDKLTPLQFYHLEKIRKAGGIALAACPENWKEILQCLLELSGGIKNAHGDVWTTTRQHIFESYNEAGKLLRL